MLQEAEEAEAEQKEAENDQSAAPTKRKAKTKFGNKRKKKKTKTTSKFPGGDEDGYEVNTVEFCFLLSDYCIMYFPSARHCADTCSINDQVDQHLGTLLASFFTEYFIERPKKCSLVRQW